MKIRHYYVAALAALTVANPLAAQTSFGVRGGMALSTMSATIEGLEDLPVDYGYVAGIHLGVTASLPRLLLSASYEQRGGSATLLGEQAANHLTYIDLGAFGRIPIGTAPYLLLGPTLGLNVACSWSYSDSSSDESGDCGGDGPETFDVGVSGGAGVSFDVGGFAMVVEALYGLGIMDIDGDDDAVLRSRGITIRAGVDFGR